MQKTSDIKTTLLAARPVYDKALRQLKDILYGHIIRQYLLEAGEPVTWEDGYYQMDISSSGATVPVEAGNGCLDTEDRCYTRRAVETVSVNRDGDVHVTTAEGDDVPVDSADEMIRLIEAIRKASEPTFQSK